MKQIWKLGIAYSTWCKKIYFVAFDMHAKSFFIIMADGNSSKYINSKCTLTWLKNIDYNKEKNYIIFNMHNAIFAILVAGD